MKNLTDPLHIILFGELRKRLEQNLLPVAEWEKHPDMPEPCKDVVTGDAFYCGLEGIGRDPHLGWYLTLLTDCENPSCTHEHKVMQSSQVNYVDNEPQAPVEVQTKWHLNLLWAEHSSKLEIIVNV